METIFTENNVERLPALLALEDGRIFECRSFTGHGEASGEIVFNTGMNGYQEILSDPSYSGQMVTMTYPLIGNYGVCRQDVESDRIHAAAILVKEYQSKPGNHRAVGTLAGFLNRQDIMGVEALDTRALNLHIRRAGAMRACVSTSCTPCDIIRKRLPVHMMLVIFSKFKMTIMSSEHSRRNA
jgi:carbamoyl-phosphate synthase small subunit